MRIKLGGRIDGSFVKFGYMVYEFTISPTELITLLKMCHLWKNIE